MHPNFKAGDLIFILEKNGALTDAIADVTCAQFNVTKPRLSHLGIYDGKGHVLESREKVRATPVTGFLELARSFEVTQVKHVHLIPKSLEFILELIGKPYNPHYIKDQNSYYCADLIAHAFEFANGGTPVFPYRPMYFGKPGERAYEIWKRHFENLGATIPEGKLGISPLAIYLSSKQEA